MPHVPLCRLIRDSCKAFVPATRIREIWIETEGEEYCPTHWGRPRNHHLELVIRPKDSDSTFHRLQTIMQRNKQSSLPLEIRISVQIELDGSAHAEGHTYRRPLPAPFRTLQLNTDGICWLEPSRRWTAIRNWIETCLGEHDRCRTSRCAISHILTTSRLFLTCWIPMSSPPPATRSGAWKTAILSASAAGY